MIRFAVPALTLVAGILIGAWGVPALKAQSVVQGAYLVAEMHVTDQAGFMDYIRREPASLMPYHAHVVARALPDVREGSAPDGVVEIIAFDTPQTANSWYNAADTVKLLALRQKSATARVYLLNGVH